MADADQAGSPRRAMSTDTDPTSLGRLFEPAPIGHAGTAVASIVCWNAVLFAGVEAQAAPPPDGCHDLAPGPDSSWFTTPSQPTLKTKCRQPLSRSGGNHHG